MNNGNSVAFAKPRRRAIRTMLGVCGVALSAGLALGQPVDSTTKTAAARVETLQPFTHLAVLPAHVDPATIRFEKVKATQVATEIKYTVDTRYCNSPQNFKGSLYCPQAKLQSYVPAYELTYSFAGPSDESGNTYSTFLIYLRPEEVPSALKDGLASRKLNREHAAEYFSFKTVNEPVRQVIVDDAQSSFCDGNFVEGAWNHTDSKCEDKISFTTAMLPVDGVGVRVDAVSLPMVQAANRVGK